MRRTKAGGLSRLAEQLSETITGWAGGTMAFATACAVVLIWAITGPLFHYSDTWQLVINTSTTIVTFLMVFLIQRSQNKDAMAIQLKLNELVAATPTPESYAVAARLWTIVGNRTRAEALRSDARSRFRGDPSLALLGKDARR